MSTREHTILIAEDEVGVRKNVAEFLSLSYKNVYEASDGLEAYDIYMEVAPDLIITDINMPGMDGLTLVEKIRETDANVPIIIVSAHSEKEKLLRAVKLNLVDYIIKPIERKTLKALIKKALQKEDEAEGNVSKEVVLGEGFTFDPDNKILYRYGDRIDLTRHQRLLIDILVRHKNQIVAGEDIFFHVQADYTLEYNSATVRNLVKKIRKIFPEEMIKNVYGSGYSLTVQENRFDEHINRYSGLLEAVAVMGPDRKLIACNAVMPQLFGYTNKEEIVGRDFLSLVHHDAVEQMASALRYDEHTTEEVRLQRKDRSIFLGKVRCKQGDIEGQSVRTISITDLSETLKRYAADPLTALRSRTVLELEFTNLMQRHREYNEAACAVFVDIDDFKQINDRAGHQAGDEVIQKVAQTLVAGVQSDDVVVRWGGDEFLLLLFNTTLEEALHRVEGLRDAINGLKLTCCDYLSCSFGVDALRPDDTIDSLVSRIDRALIRAKESGKDRVVRFTEE